MQPDVILDNGNIQLYCADCRDVISHLGKVDAVVTDPPYGIGWKRGQNNARKSKLHKGIQNDHSTECRDIVLGCFENIPSVVFGSFYAPYPALTKQVLIWNKPPDSGLYGSVTGFRRDAEPIFLVGPWPVKTVERSSVFRTIEGQAGIVTKTGHPHTKPVDLMSELIEMVNAETILDPFTGSGTTGVAAVKLKRKFIGIEIDPQYFEISVRRIKEALGEEVPDQHGVTQKKFQWS